MSLFPSPLAPWEGRWNVETIPCCPWGLCLGVLLRLGIFKIFPGDAEEPLGEVGDQVAAPVGEGVVGHAVAVYIGLAEKV